MAPACNSHVPKVETTATNRTRQAARCRIEACFSNLTWHFCGFVCQLCASQSTAYVRPGHSAPAPAGNMLLRASRAIEWRSEAFSAIISQKHQTDVSFVQALLCCAKCPFKEKVPSPQQPAHSITRAQCYADEKQKGQQASSTGSSSRSTSVGQLAADIAVNPLTYLVAIVACALFVNRFGDSNAVLLVLAALPVVGLTSLSKSSVGKEVQDNLEQQLPGVLLNSQNTQLNKSCK